MRIRWIAGAILSIITLNTPSEAQIVFSDTTMERSNWTTTGLGPGVESIVSAPTGGNPGPHSRVSTGSGAWSMAIDIRNSAVVSPALVQGITSIDYRDDFRCQVADGCFGAGQSITAIIKQGGKFYSSAFAISSGVTSVWTSAELLSLTETDFFEIDENAANAGVILIGTSHPDLSSAGAPIQFGYARVNGNIVSTVTGGVDNWSVIVTTVAAPVPALSEGSLIALGLGLLLMGRQAIRTSGSSTTRRKRRKGRPRRRENVSLGV